MTNRISHLFVVDTEATAPTPFSGVMTEFGVVSLTTKDWFHGVIHHSMPSKENPALPVLSGVMGSTLAYGSASTPVGTVKPTKVETPTEVFTALVEWVAAFGDDRAVFVSDNPGFDFMFFAYTCDEAGVVNPFGFSSRRIGDLAAGLKGKWRDTSSWKRYRKTKHTHHPVDDAMGNAEALRTILERHDQTF